MGRAAASPSGATGTAHFDDTTASPLPYANSPRSSINMINTPSPQQQFQQQQQQQQRQKMMQLPQHQQQLISPQQFRQSSVPGLGQNQLPQLHDMQGQAQQKFQSQLHGQHQMQFSQPLGAQKFQGQQQASGPVQHGIGQNQLNQGNQLNHHLNQFSSPANSALFNAAQTTPNSQIISNMSAMMPTQSLLPRMQFGLSGANRAIASQNLGDKMFNVGAGNHSNMIPMQHQQQQQGAYGNMPQNAQNHQPGMVSIQNTPQNHPNFQQQIQ